MSGLSTHVLDLTHGRPAAGVAVRLLQGGRLVFSDMTDVDGRCPGLAEVALNRGPHRLEFEVADYFRQQGLVLPEPPFLDRVGIDFGVSDASARYHVPLLVSPFGYSTYRGS